MVSLVYLHGACWAYSTFRAWKEVYFILLLEEHAVLNIALRIFYFSNGILFVGSQSSASWCRLATDYLFYFPFPHRQTHTHTHTHRHKTSPLHTTPLPDQIKIWDLRIISKEVPIWSSLRRGYAAGAWHILTWVLCGSFVCLWIIARILSAPFI